MKSMLLGAAVLLAAGQAHAFSHPPDVSSEYAVTYHQNVAHTGDIELSEPFAPPFVQLWDKQFNDRTTYALIAEGKAYFVNNGVDLFAVDLVTGNQAWEHLLSSFGNLGAYDDGQVFFVNGGGLMTALNAATGKQNWAKQMPNQSTFASPPAAQNGMVYVIGGGTGSDLYGVDQATGNVDWFKGVWSGDTTSPAIGGGAVYVDSDCHFYAFEALTGQLRWENDIDVCSGGGWTSAFSKNQVYMTDTKGQFVLNKKTGKIVGSFSGDLTPTIFKVGRHKYRLAVDNVEFNGGWIYCIDMKSGNVVWKFKTQDNVWTPPVYANGYILVGDHGGKVYALDAAKGMSRWTTSLSHQISNISIGQGAFVVTASDDDFSPAHSEVAAYAPQ